MKRSDIWIGGLYLTLLMQFLENKIAVELTRSEFVEAREVVYYFLQHLFRMIDFILLQVLTSLSYKLSRYVIQHKLWITNTVFV